MSEISNGNESEKNTPIEEKPSLWHNAISIFINFKELFLRILMMLFGNTSRIHLYEAKERYYSLLNNLEHQARINDITFPKYKKSETEDDNAHNASILDEEISKYRKFIMENIPGIVIIMEGDNPVNIRNDAVKISLWRTQEINKRIAILSCHKILHDIKRFISRNPHKLNNLWRALTGVRISLNEDITKGEFPTALQFCIEEANRLGVSNEPDIRHWIQRLSELLDSNADEMLKRFQGIYRALLERFNTIRTGRIHQQYINVKNYLIALALLVFLTIPLLTVELLGTTPAMNDNGLCSEETSPVLAVFCFFRSLVIYNPLTFVAYAGFLGGLFSVTMRARHKELPPGEDVYSTWYVMTKPLIGAVGAVFFYLLFIGGFVSSELVISEMENLKTITPLTFGFAFIAGFSERLVFPSFR